ncbi:retron St85 family RNA-directed DNA polymerase [Pseudoalteromonas sp. 5-MNA-CIBAN-0065]|uniref:retron St85 family RNA-directed DNA polymerase n=1 Tax=Pseudoalteromonas sp. 5-MNA-CIBAN-0065 TaxID=3140421 RepID=UPI0033318098
MTHLIDKVSTELGIGVSEIYAQLPSAPLAYKTFKIPKKNGGFRQVSQPNKLVKSIQRGLIKLFISQFPVHRCANAYVEGKSLIDNAKPHLDNSFLLKLDFENFFPSISHHDLITYLELKNIELSSLDHIFIKNYLFKKNKNNEYHLCIGAPSSPMISNILMYSFDEIVEEMCNLLGVQYTRYADDLTFSCNDYDTLQKSLHQVKEIVENYTFIKGLTINNNKTTIVGKGRSRRVTGVIITNEGNPSVGRYTRKKIRAMLHHFNNKSLNKDDIPYLHGIVSHINSIEPNFYKKLKEQYGEVLFSRLAKLSYIISKSKKEQEINKEESKKLKTTTSILRELGLSDLLEDKL